MKKCFLAILIVSGCVHAMEIEQNTLRSLKKTIITPQGLEQEVTISFYDENEIDPISQESFKDLLNEYQKNNIPLILAQATYIDKDNRAITTSYEAVFLLQHLFGQNFFDPKPNRYNDLLDFTKKDPLTRLQYQGPINFFKLNDNGTGVYIGSDWDLHVNPTTKIGLDLKKNILLSYEDDFQKILNEALHKFTTALNTDNPELKTKILTKTQITLELIALQEKDLVSKEIAELYIDFLNMDVEINLVTTLQYFQNISVQQPSNLVSQSEAQARLGKMYYFGQGVQKDYQKAREYFESAAAQNANPRAKIIAQAGLGEMYYSGLGAQQDYQKAYEYFESAAAQNTNQSIKAFAQTWLGEMHYSGRGVQQDYQKARKYFEFTATQNANQSVKFFTQNRLAEMYYLGYGVQNDYQKARQYFESSAIQNIDRSSKAFAEARLGEMYYYHIADQGAIQRDYQKAQEYFESAAAQNFNPRAKAIAQNRLGEMYYYGYGVLQDYQRAREYFESAAQSTDQSAKAFAQNWLGEIYFSGYGVQQDYQKAQEYFESAAAQNVNEEVKALAEKKLEIINKELSSKKRNIDDIDPDNQEESSEKKRKLNE